MLEIIEWLASIDREVFIFINITLANPVTDLLMPVFTNDNYLRIFYALCLIGILWKGDKRLKIAIVFSIITIALTDQISANFLKSAIERLRPCKVMEVHLLYRCGAGYAMPSAHAANLFGQAYFFFVVARPSGKFLIPLAIIVALSRVFVGVHYPGDILVGAALGTVVGYGVGKLYQEVFVRKYIAKDRKETEDEPGDESNQG